MKHFAVGFLCFLTAVLILCVMELSTYNDNDIANWQLTCLGFAATISTVMCIAAAVAIAESK